MITGVVLLLARVDDRNTIREDDESETILGESKVIRVPVVVVRVSIPNR